MRRFKNVEVGQRFRSIGVITGTPTSTYEVQSVFRSRIDQREYARLADIDDPTLTKSITVSTLLNARQFSLVC